MNANAAVLVNQSSTTVYQIERAILAFIAGFSSPYTRDTYGRGLKQFFAWTEANGLDPFGEDCRKLTIEMWLRNLEDRGLARNTRALSYAILSSFFKWAVEEGVCLTDPTARVKAPRKEDPVLPAMDKADMHRFLKSAQEILNPYEVALLLTMCLTTVRVGTICRADIEAMWSDRWQHYLRVTAKGDKVQDIPLQSLVVEAIEEAIGDRTSGPLFLNRAGNRMERANVARAIRKAAKHAGIAKHLTPHSLRRSGIQIAIDEGENLRDLQKLTGHASMKTLLMYDRRELDPMRSPSYTIMRAVA